jgi:glutamine synthetase adenylyltransferase
VKFVCGNKRLFNVLIISYLKRIDNLNTEEILRGIYEIRTKSLSAFPAEVQLIDLKKNSGGLNDIEYIAHYLILSNPELVKKYIGSSTPEILTHLSKEKKEWTFLKSLADNYIFLKELDMFNQIATNIRSSKISEETERLDKLTTMIKIESGSELIREIRSILKENWDAYSKLIT